MDNNRVDIPSFDNDKEKRKWIEEHKDDKCSDCNEKVYFSREILGTPFIVRKDCSCERKQKEFEEQKRKAYEHKEKVKMLKRDCFSVVNTEKCTFEKDNGLNSKMDIAKNYVEKWTEMSEKNQGLLLMGDTGTGKTYMASAIANALIEKEVSVKIVNFEYINNELFDTQLKNRWLEKLKSYDLLIIDDLGSERDTSYSMENVFTVIDQRVNSGKPMIITSNIRIDDIDTTKDLTKRRIYDRINLVCIPVIVNDVDIRDKEISRRNAEGIATLLS